MNIKHSLLSAALVSLSALSFAPNAAQAGSLDNAAVACYVDTFAYDQLSTDYCAATWTPSTANIVTIAHFEVVGLQAGSYSFYWNQSTCGNNRVCNTSITAQPEQEIKGSVLIVNNLTGEQKGVYAYAEYINGWN